MKLTRKSKAKGSILIFGAHPDDIEFGCGGIAASESLAGRSLHYVICSHGESGSFTDSKTRQKEATAAAKINHAHLHFLELDGDAKLQIQTRHCLTLAKVIRSLSPEIVLCPTTVKNQHPDHYKLGDMVRDAARLARYAGLEELKGFKAHKIKHLFFYALSPSAEPTHKQPLHYDISSSGVLTRWKKMMLAHKSQVKSKKYVELQLSRARVAGLSSGLEYAQTLFCEDNLVISTLDTFTSSARSF